MIERVILLRHVATWGDLWGGILEGVGFALGVLLIGLGAGGVFTWFATRE